MAELRLYRNATITGFKENSEAHTLTIYFEHHGNSYHTFAHPALAYRADDEAMSPAATYAKEKLVTDITVRLTDEGYKTYECLKPTQQRVTAYNNALTRARMFSVETIEIPDSEIQDQGF